MTLIAGADQRAADRHRLGVAGVVAYCPVCRRPSTSSPTDPGTALRRVVGHLRADHDPYFLALLALFADAAAADPDPFYPTGASW